MTVNIEKRIEVFAQLGKILRNFLLLEKKSPQQLENSVNNTFSQKLQEGIKRAEIENPWFTREFLLISLTSWADLLTYEKLSGWLSKYPLDNIGKEGKEIGLIPAGNIPLVGFHDILCVILTGHYAVTKLSSKDRILYPLLREIIAYIDPSTAERWKVLEEGRLSGIDAVIATGSDNTSRYFDYYFGRYPHIIRKNRNSAAVLTGRETEREKTALADDIFIYFGLGCRSVSKLYVPHDFTPDQFYPFVEHYSYLYFHTKYANNYDYQRAVHLLNRIEIFDNGFLILKHEKSFSSPVACLHFEKYKSESKLIGQLEANKEKIQCIVSHMKGIPNRIPFGISQFPSLNEYADDIDTLEFLLNLYKK